MNQSGTKPPDETETKTVGREPRLEGGNLGLLKCSSDRHRVSGLGLLELQGRSSQFVAMAVVPWLLAIGTVWGITNALIKRGALIAEEVKRTSKQRTEQEKNFGGVVGGFFLDWFRLLCVWQYSVPFLLNLSMSVLFVIKLGDSPITLAVPVTNATTFAVTAVTGAALGENLRLVETMAGVLLIVAGVTLCISPPFNFS